MSNILNLSNGLERQVFSLSLFLLGSHVMACFWIFSAQVVEHDEVNWISDSDAF